MLEITRHNTPFQVDVKRLYLPFTVVTLDVTITPCPNSEMTQ
jgi:hypothetical protein